MKKEETIEKILSNFQVPEERSKEAIWKEIDAKINSGSSSKKSRIFKLNRLIPLGAAACIALAFLFLLPSGELVSYNTGAGEFKSYDLPDGSSVDLSPMSSLSYEESDGQRLIQLDGEAFFDVVKGKPFTVHTDLVNVNVLGTSFNVNSRNSDFDVRCFTGKVAVNSSDVEVQLTRGIGINSSNGNDTYEHSSRPKISANNEFSFDNQLLNTVLEDLKIYKGISITNVSNSNPVISFDYKNESSEEILDIISTISNLSVKTLGDNKFELY